MISAIGSDVRGILLRHRTRCTASTSPGLVSVRYSAPGRDAPEDALDLGIRAEPLVLVKRHSRITRRREIRGLSSPDQLGRIAARFQTRGSRAFRRNKTPGFERRSA